LAFQSEDFFCRCNALVNEAEGCYSGFNALLDHTLRAIDDVKKSSEDRGIKFTGELSLYRSCHSNGFLLSFLIVVASFVPVSVSSGTSSTLMLASAGFVSITAGLQQCRSPVIRRCKSIIFNVSSSQ
jgi:hypothetical protein